MGGDVLKLSEERWATCSHILPFWASFPFQWERKSLQTAWPHCSHQSWVVKRLLSLPRTHPSIIIIPWAPNQFIHPLLWLLSKAVKAITAHFLGTKQNSEEPSLGGRQSVCFLIALHFFCSNVLLIVNSFEIYKQTPYLVNQFRNIIILGKQHKCQELFVNAARTLTLLIM